MASRIEQIIEEIEEYIDGCKPQTFSSSKIIVNREEMEELLNELRIKTPEEIKRYQKIISNKEAILADAQAKADAIIAQAQVKTDELVSEHQIMQQAYAQANEVVMIATKQAQEILDNATNDANNIRMGAMQYTDDILRNLENTISHSMDAAKARPAGIPGGGDGEPCRAQSDCRGAGDQDDGCAGIPGRRSEGGDLFGYAGLTGRTVSQMKDL